MKSHDVHTRLHTIAFLNMPSSSSCCSSVNRGTLWPVKNTAPHQHQDSHTTSIRIHIQPPPKLQCYTGTTGTQYTLVLRSPIHHTIARRSYPSMAYRHSVEESATAQGNLAAGRWPPCLGPGHPERRNEQEGTGQNVRSIQYSGKPAVTCSVGFPECGIRPRHQLHSFHAIPVVCHRSYR